MTVADAPPVRQIRPRPGPQEDFVLSKARHPALFAARRFGKTVASVIKTVKYMAEYPGARGLATMPEWKDVEFFYLPTWNELLGPPNLKSSHWDWHETKRQITLRGSTAILFVRPALQPEGLVGATLAFASMDEIAVDNQYPAYKTIDAAVSQPGYPLQLWVTSTPNVRYPWLRQLWKDHVNPLNGEPLKRPHDYPILYGEMKDNFYLDPEYIEEQYDTYDGTREGDQRLRGWFITTEGLAFPEFNRNVHVKAPPADTEFVRTAIGQDFGTTSPTSIHIIKQDTAGRLWVVDEFYKGGAREEEWVEWLGERDVRRVNCDPAVARDLALEYSRRYGIRYVPAMGRRKFPDRWNFWSTHLANGQFGPKLFISPLCSNLIDEIENLAFAQSRFGQEKEQTWAPGCADHAYDSVAYGAIEFATMLKYQPVSFKRILYA